MADGLGPCEPADLPQEGTEAVEKPFRRLTTEDHHRLLLQVPKRLEESAEPVRRGKYPDGEHREEHSDGSEELRRQGSVGGGYGAGNCHSGETEEQSSP